jgi:GYF domain 2
MQYYYHHNGQQLGPFSIEELQQKPIDKNTLVWKPGMEKWVSAGELAELAAVFQPVMVPPPLPVQAVGQKEGFDYVTWFWRFAAVGSFVVMVGVAWWLMSQSKASSEPKTDDVQPEIEQVVTPPEEPNTVVVPSPPVESEKPYNWKEYIKVEYNSDFSIDGIGGVNNLKVILINNSEFEITLARAQAIIYKQNGTSIIKEVSFQNVPPRSIAYSAVIETTRGKSVGKPVIVQLQSTNGEISYLSGQETKDKIGKLFN